MNRLGAAVVGSVLLAALYAWYVKGDLEMGWLYVGPSIVAVTVILVALGSLALPAGFPRVAAGLAALPFGMLLAWIAASTPSTWPVPPEREWMAAARRSAVDTAHLQALARETMGAPLEVAAALADSTDGFTRKVSGRLGLERREPRVRLTVSFAVGPWEPLRLDVAPDGALSVLSPAPDAARTVIRPEAVERRYPQTPLVEVGGNGPYSPGQTVPLRLMRAEDDWSLEVVRVLADGQALSPVRRWSRDEIRAALTARLSTAGERPARIAVYFRPAGLRVMYFQAPAFDFLAPLVGGGFATLRASLRADTIAFELVHVNR